MASIALLLCTVFVLILLWIEQRHSPEVSLGVWIPTIWMMMMASRPLSIWFGITPTHIVAYGGNESGSMLDKWTLTLLASLAIIVFIYRRFDWLSALRQQKWLVALLVYMLVSTFWSDLTLIALRRWARETIALIMALFLMSERHPSQALASVLRRSAYVLIPFSVVLIKYYPALGRSYGKFSGMEMWTGVTGQKNLLGRLCMIGTFFLSWCLYQRWREHKKRDNARYLVWADISVILIAVYLLVGSDSSTSLATLVLGCVIYFGFRCSHKFNPRVLKPAILTTVIFLMGFGVATPFVGGSTVANFTALLGRDSTLTGRTEVWADVLPAREQRPLLGYGLGSFWTDARRQFYDIPTAHNGYLDVLLELGEVGFALCVIWMLSCASQLHRALAQDYEWASFAICLLLMGLAYNISESALNTFTEEMTALVVLASSVVTYKPILASGRRTSRTATMSRLPGADAMADTW